VNEEIRNKAETGKDIVLSLVENAHDVHMNVVGWDFNRENIQGTKEEWVKLSDVLKVLDSHTKQLRETRPERCFKECKCCQRFDEWIRGFLESEEKNTNEVLLS